MPNPVKDGETGGRFIPKVYRSSTVCICGGPKGLHGFGSSHGEGAYQLGNGNCKRFVAQTSTEADGFYTAIACSGCGGEGGFFNLGEEWVRCKTCLGNCVKHEPRAVAEFETRKPALPDDAPSGRERKS